MIMFVSISLSLSIYFGCCSRNKGKRQTTRPVLTLLYDSFLGRCCRESSLMMISQYSVDAVWLGFWKRITKTFWLLHLVFSPNSHHHHHEKKEIPFMKPIEINGMANDEMSVCVCVCDVFKLFVYEVFMCIIRMTE